MQQPTTEGEFEAFFRNEYTGLVCVVARIVDERSAEDVVQVAFSKLHDRLPLDPLHARNLLYRIALNGALSARRADLRRTARERRFHAEIVDDPVEEFERRETRELVRRVLLRLARSHASVLALRYSGYSYREVAEILNLSMNHVGVLLHRAELAFEKEYERVSSR
jgi:RNA polymerase sigma factor (sigma-70 family)